jgi:endonuclease G
MADLPYNNQPVNPGKLEAIIQARGRPTVLIQNDTFPTVPLGPFQQQVDLAFYMVKKYLRSVGRIYAVPHIPRMRVKKYFGTGWLINDNIMVTNRHVALEFASIDKQIHPNLMVKVNFTAEHMSLVTEEAQITEVLYIASGNDVDRGIDAAIVRLKWPANHRFERRVPIPLETDLNLNDGTNKDHPVVVIGHPAYDSRNPVEDMTYYFGDIYDVKRLSPGYAYRDAARRNPSDIHHDATTLGGSSGSVVLSLVTGKAIGLHYGGLYGVANVAVASTKLVEIVNDLHAELTLPEPPQPLLGGPSIALEGVVSKEELNARSGYNPNFLGDVVPLPTVKPELQSQLAMNGPGFEFKYEHFSIVFNQSRRMAFFTAVNIDGSRLVKLRRGNDVWKFDSRIDPKLQLPNSFYKNARKEGLLFDRGHLVRRLDPCWGDDDTVEQANDDTFHFTNCTPQHKDLNQKTWLELEDYVLSRADNNNYLVSVFTGPVLDKHDGRFDGVKIPSEFWKVVVTRHNGRLFADFRIGGENTDNPPCFLQIATDQSCLIIVLREMNNANLPSIKEIFQSNAIIKWGINTETDRKKFALFFHYSAEHWYDLRDFAKYKLQIKAPGTGPMGQLHGVHSLCEALLGKFFVETPELTLTDWSSVEIHHKHASYMALDAWLCVDISKAAASLLYKRMEHKAIIK